MSVVKYNEYINEALTPEEIRKKKETILASYMKMYLSEDLSNILKTMNSPIAADLLSLSSKDVKFDISFMDIKKGAMVTFINTMKVKKMEEKGLNIETARNDYDSEIWTSSQRVQPTRINRQIGKLFTGKYTPSQIEQFGNEFKAKESKQDDKMKIVYGEDIRFWYNEKNHSRTIVGGTLNTSCMRGSDKQKFFDLYCKNKPGDSFSHIGLLILLDDDGKLIGRALVWFNSVRPEPGKVFMDRIYYMKDSDQITFIDYAKKNGWLYKQHQTYNNANYMDPSDPTGKKHGLTLTYRLKPGKYNKYPFLDTLLFYTPDTGRLSSKQNKNRKYETIKIQDQYGGFQRL